MAGFLLTAKDDLLFAASATEVLTTTVKYEAPQPISLWRRVDQTVWTKEPLTAGASSAAEAAELEKTGTRTTPGLKAGESIEYGMLTENIDPNDGGFSLGRFAAYLIIDVLLTPTTLVEAGPDDGLYPGGTFVRKRVHTNATTRLRIKIGRAPAVPLPNGFPVLPNPVAEQTSGPAKVHDVIAVPLVPGTSYVALTLLVNDKGEWQAIEESFSTKRRKVTIQFKNFKVDNDGDESPWGEGDDAEIWFRVFSGQDEVSEFHWGPGQITDETQGGKNVVWPNFPDAVVGPDDFDGVDPGLGLGISALERDWFLGIPSTDEAEYSQGGRTIKPFQFPVGKGESVNPKTTDTNFEITARHKPDDGELQITARVRYVVAYE